jgi:general secretion pathway protein G
MTRITKIVGPGDKSPVNSPSGNGFTLIEVLVVVAILGILAAIVVPRIMDRPDEAKRVAAKADIGAIVQALKLYRLDNGFYPTTDQGLGALVQRPGAAPVPSNWKQGGYLERLPRIPGA